MNALSSVSATGQVDRGPTVLYFLVQTMLVMCFVTLVLLWLLCSHLNFHRVTIFKTEARSFSYSGVDSGTSIKKYIPTFSNFEMKVRCDWMS